MIFMTKHIRLKNRKDMAKKTEQEKYAELMEMKTNKAAKQIVHVITSSDLSSGKAGTCNR